MTFNKHTSGEDGSVSEEITDIIVEVVGLSVTGVLGEGIVSIYPAVVGSDIEHSRLLSVDQYICKKRKKE